MRKIKHGTSYLNRYLKGLPKGVCDQCGGKGRYKVTYAYKNPVIHFCLPCKGTGKVSIRVTYIGDNKDIGLWQGQTYDVVTESEAHYVVFNRNKEFVQMDKKEFKPVR